MVADNSSLHRPLGFQLGDVQARRSGRVVLKDVVLDIPPASVTVLMGPSGAGKTTLLRLLNRLDDPAAGTIRYRGEPLTSYAVTSLRLRVGFVFQTPVMFPGTVADNLGIAAEIAGLPTADVPQRSSEVMALAELHHSLAGRNGSELSVGQQQRVNIARALMATPETLLLDEPTAALDVETARGLLKTVRTLCSEQALMVVLTTHRPDDARQVGDQIVMLRDGRVLEIGTPDEVLGSAVPR